MATQVLTITEKECDQFFLDQEVNQEAHRMLMELIDCYANGDDESTPVFRRDWDLDDDFSWLY
jgi:hypothetical protein